ncbi:MAG: VWA domain-containing protein [Acidobacteria bacterium]|nr:VWA domain-containing protein [Acidobacteriota bacterium]
MEFVEPRYFWLLAAVPFLVILWGVGLWHHQRVRARFGNLDNLDVVSRISWSGRGWFRGALFTASILAMVLGLAYPRMVSRELRPVPTPTDLVFMLDISPSMYARDMDPSRLGQAEEIIQRFILLKESQDRYGLVVFNWNSVVLSYLTSDPQSILLYFDYLNQQDEPELGSNMGAALTSALRVFDIDEQVNPGNAEKRRRILVLLSDGDDNAGELAEPLTEVAKREIKVYTFGLGSSNGAYVPVVMSGGVHGEVIKYITRSEGSRVISRSEDRTMRNIAERTGARFFRGEINTQWQQGIDEILVSGRPVAGYQANPVRRDLYFYFLSAAFICLVIGIFL